MTSTFVHIETDAGITGIGGPITADQAYIIKHNMEHYLLGADPLAIERLWDVLYRAAVHGRKGVEMMAISAIDCALWDLKGKWANVPVYVLLGGPMRDELPAYASALGYGLDPDRAAEVVKEIVGKGYRATKWFPRWGPADGRAGIAKNVELMRTLREAAGPDVDIMIDAWMSWDVPYTLAMAERFAEYQPRWIEEPVLPDKPASYAAITAKIGHGIAVSGAEHEYTRWGIHQLMQANAMNVYQPDIYWAGGISELLKIAALASVYDVQLIPHGHSTPATAQLPLRPTRHALPDAGIPDQVEHDPPVVPQAPRRAGQWLRPAADPPRHRHGTGRREDREPAGTLSHPLADEKRHGR